MCAGEQLLRGEFEKLLQLLRPETSVEKADLQQMKDKVFGPQTFFVTETRLTEEYLTDAGWLVRSPASCCQKGQVEELSLNSSRNKMEA